MTLAVAAFVAALVVLTAVMAARDMDKRGRSGEVYAVAILFVLPLGLLMWALDRRRPPAAAEGPAAEDGESASPLPPDPSID